MHFELWPQFSDFARFLCAFALKALMNRRKLTLKDYPKNKDVTLDENAKNRKQKRKKMLQLDSSQTSLQSVCASYRGQYSDRQT